MMTSQEHLSRHYRGYILLQVQVLLDVAEEERLSQLPRFSHHCWHNARCQLSNSIIILSDVAEQERLSQLPRFSHHCWHSARCQLSNSIVIPSQEGAVPVVVKEIYFEQEEYQAEDSLVATRRMVELVVVDVHCLAPGTSV